MPNVLRSCKGVFALLFFSGVSGVSGTCDIGLARDNTWKVTIGMFCDNEHPAIGTYVNSGESNAFSPIYVKLGTSRVPQTFLYLEVTSATTAIPETLMWYISSSLPLSFNTITGAYDVRFAVSDTNRTVTSIANSNAFVKCTPTAVGHGVPVGLAITRSFLRDTECKCDYNYELANGKCRMCADGRFKTVIFNSSCSACPSRKLYTDLRTCTCLPGSTGDIGKACVPCLAGTFNDAGGTVACKACPLHAVSESNSNTITNCTCDRGYSGPDGGNCTVCAAGKYKNTQASGSCTNCPEGTFSNVSGAVTSNVCHNCTNNSSSHPGSSNQSACECVAGYYGVNGDRCAKCGTDTYSADRGSSSCTQCPFGRHAPLGGTSLDACVCMKGHDSQCECAIGSTHVYQTEFTVATFNCFLSDVGNGVYINTGFLHENSSVYYSTKPAPRFLYRRDPEWWISTQFNALEYELKFGACLYTPETPHELALPEWDCRDAMQCNGDVRWNNKGQVSVANVSKCVCNANCVRNVYGVCTQCAPAFYKLVTETGFSDCRPCPANSSTLDPTEGIDGCGCKAGFSGPNNGVCVQCAPGTHKFGIGPAQCAKCPDTLHPFHIAFDASLQVLQCRTCQIGFAWNSGTQQCVQCAVNEFNNRPGDNVCFPCVSIPEYFPLQDNLQSWFQFETGGAYGWADGARDSSIHQRHGNINFNVHIRFPGPLDNVDFAEGSASLGISAHDMGLNSVYLGGSDASILFHFKYHEGGSGAVAMLLERNNNWIKILRHSNQLHFEVYDHAWLAFLSTNVPGGLVAEKWHHFAWILDVARSRWTIYIDGERIWIPVGFRAPSLRAGWYQVGRSHIRHKMDDFRTYNRVLSQYEVRNAYRQRDIHATCGLTNSSGTACPRLCSVTAGYQTTPLGANVELCPANSYQNGFSLKCQLCPLGSSTNTSGNTDVSACVCAMGYTRQRPGIGSCKPCAVGTFKAMPGPGACTVCAAGHFSDEGAIICGCDVGFTGDAVSRECKACEVGKYKNVTGSAACDMCGTLRTSGLASRNVSDCKCNQGFVGLDTGSCESNTTCPLDAHNISGSSRMSCRCNAGYTGLDAWGPCESCQAGKYKEVSGSTDCSFCTPDSNSASASTRRSDCLCNAGFYKDNNHFCKPCRAGTYKTSTGPHDCTMCPLHSNSVAASTRIQDCICEAGYTGVGTHNCTACTFGKFKSVIGSALCQSCGSNSASQSASTSEEDCYCMRGYRRNLDASIPGTNADLAAFHTGKDAWRLVRFLPPSSKVWYVADNLRGTHTTGVAYHYNNQWTIPFGVFDEFLFGTFNLAKWAHCTKSAGTTTSGSNAAGVIRTSVLQTSANRNPHALAWHIISPASGDAQDARPYISIGDFPIDVVYSTAQAVRLNLVPIDGGMAVWVRHGSREWCRMCEPDTYTDKIGEGVCIKCPENSRALAGSTSKSACICIAGYAGTNGDICVPCPDHTYRTTGALQSCVACPENTTSTKGSIVCLCKAGFTGPDNAICTSCRAGTAKGVAGAHACTLCPVNTTSESEGSSHCVCVRGMYGRGLVWAHERAVPSGLPHPEGDLVDCVPCPRGHIISPTHGDCVPCGINTYNPAPLGVECISCPNNTRSPSESVQQTDCKCRGVEDGDTGLFGPDGGPCDACLAGYSKGTLLRSGSCDEMVKSNSTVTFPHAVDTPLRIILASSFREEWELGDQIRVHRSGSRRPNDVVLTYVHTLIRGNYWAPFNVNPLLRIDDTYRFFVRRPILFQQNASESGLALRIV